MEPSELQVCVWNRDDWLICDLIQISLLRDNVQHHLERGVPSERFANLHALADVFWQRAPIVLDSATLSAELVIGWGAVWQIPVAELALSLRTRALLSGARTPPAVSGTVLHRRASWALPFDAGVSVVGELVANLVSELVALAAKSTPDESIRAAMSASHGDASPHHRGRHSRAGY